MESKWYFKLVYAYKWVLRQFAKKSKHREFQNSWTILKENEQANNNNNNYI